MTYHFRIQACFLVSILFGAFSSAQAFAQESAPAPIDPAEPAPDAVTTEESAPPPAIAAEEPAPPPPGTAAATDLAPTPEAAPAPKKPPYSLPWQLRPVAPATVVRSDTAIGLYKSPAEESGTTIATTLLGSYKINPNFGVLARLGLTHDAPPKGATLAPMGAERESTASLMNPVLGGIYAPEIPAPFKLSFFLGVALPLGGGAGDKPDTASAQKLAANTQGIFARSAMDNAMFATNYLVVLPGIDFAYVADGLTAQVEATLIRLMNVRGPDTIDDANTNLTAGLHVGYFLIPELSAAVELRHQRWLTTPTGIKGANEDILRDNSTLAIGPRAHFKFGESTWFRPGVAVALPLDRPMAGKVAAMNPNREQLNIQIDLPLVF